MAAGVRSRGKGGAANYIVGVDLGGTKVAAALARPDGSIVGRALLPTEASKGAEHVLERVLKCVEMVVRDANLALGDIAGIGIGSPGPVDIERGIVVQAPSLSWKDMHIVSILEGRFGVPCFVDNDANLGALAEYHFGAGRGSSSVVYVTVSTGIGAGIILDGRLHRGAQGRAGELGHMIMIEDGPLCSCGSRGCLEAVASGTAIARQARERAAKEGDGILLELAGGDSRSITAQVVAEADRRGDPIARWAIDSAVRYLGLGLATLVNVLNPDLIIVGGGVSMLGDRLFTPLREAIRFYAMGDLGSCLRLSPAELGNDSCLLGAVSLVLEEGVRVRSCS